MISIINYNAGNLRNVQKMFDLYECKTVITSLSDDIEKSTALILPGVGHFQDGMNNLENLGLVQTIRKVVQKNKIPILGICLGMQLFARAGFEGEERAGLNLLDMHCKHLNVNDNSLRLPHIGWNSIKVESSSRLLKNIPNNSDFYFVHNYAIQAMDKSIISSTAYYGNDFVASIEYNNIYGTQFHPEKSQKYGKIVIKNFIDIINSYNQ